MLQSFTEKPPSPSDASRTPWEQQAGATAGHSGSPDISQQNWITLNSYFRVRQTEFPLKESVGAFHKSVLQGRVIHRFIKYPLSGCEVPGFHVPDPGPAPVTQGPQEAPGSNGEGGGFPLCGKGYEERNDGL